MMIYLAIAGGTALVGWLAWLSVMIMEIKASTDVTATTVCSNTKRIEELEELHPRTDSR
jgi:hypothetical protein